jgi:hypothetical protein
VTTMARLRYELVGGPLDGMIGELSAADEAVPPPCLWVLEGPAPRICRAPARVWTDVGELVRYELQTGWTTRRGLKGIIASHQHYYVREGLT